jgi:transcriptional regulator with PAS, ATPase and Fis domain
MRRVIDLAEKYSTDRSIPVLIEGETGTGKELIAQFIHHYGHGKTLSPFVAINCGAMPRELFESELFGHERGAYTGATATGRMGKLELANKGTLFLDEISEMPLSSQVDLLRVLEDKKFYRLGGVKEIPIDVRFISATNKDRSISSIVLIWVPFEFLRFGREKRISYHWLCDLLIALPFNGGRGLVDLHLPQKNS